MRICLKYVHILLMHQFRYSPFTLGKIRYWVYLTTSGTTVAGTSAWEIANI